MIKVLQVIDVINQNSGVSSVVMNYYKYMNNPNIIFDFLVHEDVADDIREEIEDKGSTIYQMSSLSGHNIPRYINELKMFFKAHKGEYAIIHGHIPNASLFYMSVAKKFGIPIRIIHSHNSRGADGILKKARNYILNHVGIRNANIYLACSKLAGEYLYGKGKKRQIRVLHNAIDIERFRYDENIRNALRKKYRIKDKLVIGHVGRFQGQKNHTFILDIAEAIKERMNVIFVLLGDGPLREPIEKEIEKRGLKDIIRVVGTVDNPQDYYQMMDVFILPSLYEGLPVVGVEAQAAGLPCLFSEFVTEEAKLTELVHFLPIRNALDWVECIATINVERVDYSSQLIQEGFSIQQEAENLSKLYEELVEMYINSKDDL